MPDFRDLSARPTDSQEIPLGDIGPSLVYSFAEYLREADAVFADAQRASEVRDLLMADVTDREKILKDELAAYLLERPTESPGAVSQHLPSDDLEPRALAIMIDQVWVRTDATKLRDRKKELDARLVTEQLKWPLLAQVVVEDISPTQDALYKLKPSIRGGSWERGKSVQSVEGVIMGVELNNRGGSLKIENRRKGMFEAYRLVDTSRAYMPNVEVTFLDRGQEQQKS